MAEGKLDPLISAKIEELSKKAPRFLFRAWSSLSGNHFGLNTPTAITPLAFRLGIGPASIHDMSRDRLASIAQKHLCNAPTKTVFSSWTQSLECVLGWGHAECASNYAHISVIDTKHLDPRNVVLYTPEMTFIDPNIPTAYRNEYLVFGPVSGPVHKAISLKALVGELKPAHLFPLTENPRSTLSTQNLRSLSLTIQQALLCAHGMAVLYGDHFALPLTLYFIVLFDAHWSREKNHILEKMAGWSVPTEWYNDLEHPIGRRMLFGSYVYYDAAIDDAHTLIQLVIAKAKETLPKPRDQATTAVATHTKTTVLFSPASDVKGPVHTKFDAPNIKAPNDAATMVKKDGFKNSFVFHPTHIPKDGIYHIGANAGPAISHASAQPTVPSGTIETHVPKPALKPTIKLATNSLPKSTPAKSVKSTKIDADSIEKASRELQNLKITMKW